MQDIISQILDGNYGYETGTLDFSCAKLEFTVDLGLPYEGSFTVLSSPGQLTTGYVTSSTLIMECLTKSFTGTAEEIRFCFHGEQLDEGETVNGEFQITSNQGEYTLPFLATITRPQLPSSIGNLKNMFHFANLAKSSWKEAVALFYKPEFLTLFRGNDKQYLELYHGLSVYPDNEQNVEEFLISIHKKVRMEYLTEEKQLSLDNPQGIAETVLTIARNGWGYTHLRVEIDGEFAFTEKNVLTEDDFLGHYCRLPIYVDSRLLTTEHSVAHIHLTNPYMEVLGEKMTIPLTVTRPEPVLPGRKPYLGPATLRREEKQIFSRIMELYQSMRLHKIGTASWLTEAGKLVERMRTLDERDCVAKLFHVQLLATQERFNEAAWLLEHTEHLLREEDGPYQNAIWAYYLYLTTLVNRDEAYVAQVAEEVEDIYQQDSSEWRVGWLLLYLSKEYLRSPSHRWEFMDKQISLGCYSPIMYVEALILLNSNPTFLRKLGRFELQVVLYGIRRSALSAEVLEQLLYLAAKVKEFDRILFEILKSCYTHTRDVRFLREICVLLIKGGKTGTGYFEWFRLGVENELRITKLYEYYMESLPIPPMKASYWIDQNSRLLLPKTVIMYFSYQSNLDQEHSAFLYAVVYHDRHEYPELYEGYQSRIQRFVEDQIGKAPYVSGTVSPYLNYLYKELLTPSMITQAGAESLAILCFIHRILPQAIKGEKLFRKVIVCRPGVLTPREYAMEGSLAWVPVYQKDSTLLLEDGEGNRYGVSVPCSLEDMSLPSRLVEAAAPFVEQNIDFCLYLYDNHQNPERWPGWMPDKCTRLSASAEVSPDLRRELTLKILAYYYEKDDFRSLGTFLDEISPEELSGRERGEALRYMLLCERMDLAWDWVATYGPEFADKKALLRLTSDKIQQTEFVRSKMLMHMALTAFRQSKYDGNILRYLSLYFQGTLKEMMELWKAARSFEVDCYKLSERILLQTLFTHSEAVRMTEVFRYYVTQGAKPGVEEAFLSQCAYDYFVKGIEADAYVFQEILHMEKRGEPVNYPCKLAFLQFAADHDEIHTTAHFAIEKYLGELIRDGIHLEFFRRFKDFPSLLAPMQDKTILEYRTRSKNPVRLTLMLCQDEGEAGEYRDMEMRRVLGGVFFQEFILFFGESIQYHVVENKDGQEELVERGILQMSDRKENQGDTKFELLNEMVISKSLRDIEMLQRLAENFYWKEYLGERLFFPMV
jgi:hypothetical protein